MSDFSRLGLPGQVEVHLQEKVRALGQPRGHALGEHHRRRAHGPPAEPTGIAAIVDDADGLHPAEARPAVGAVARRQASTRRRTRRSRDARPCGRSDETRRRAPTCPRSARSESRNCGTHPGRSRAGRTPTGISRMRSGCPSRQPSAGNDRQLRHLRLVATRHAAFDPGVDRRDLRLGQPPLTDELAIPRSGVPGRHVLVGPSRGRSSLPRLTTSS